MVRRIKHFENSVIDTLSQREIRVVFFFLRIPCPKKKFSCSYLKKKELSKKNIETMHCIVWLLVLFIVVYLSYPYICQFFQPRRKPRLDPIRPEEFDF